MTTPSSEVTPAQMAERCHPRRSAGMPELSRAEAETPPGFPATELELMAAELIVPDAAPVMS